MINFKWENHNFYTIKDLLDERDVIQIKKDVVRECLDNYIEGYPKFQSYPDLHTKYKTTSWKNLINKVTENVNKIKQCKLIKCWANYINDESELKNPYASPVYGNFDGFPPILIQVGSREVLLDDSKKIEERAKSSGCDVTLEIWDDMVHVFHGYAPFLPEANEAIDKIGLFISDK